MAEPITTPAPAAPAYNPSLVETPSSEVTIPSTSKADPASTTDPFLSPEEGGSAAGVKPATPDVNAQPGQQTTQTPAVDGEEPERIENPTLEQILAADISQLEDSDRKILEENKDKLTPEQLTKYGLTKEEKLFAGKFKTEADLKAAYVNLGGDPNKYDTVEKLEEAYEVRNAEFTRSRQVISEQNKNTSEPPKVEDITENVMKMMDFSKVANAEDLAKQLITALVQSIPKQDTPTEEEMTARLLPKIQEREQKLKELSEIEDKVPRLKIVRDANGVAIPNPFRDAFAIYCDGLKRNGQFKNMDDAMKTFLSVGEITATAVQTQKELEAKNKNTTITPPDNGSGLPAKKTADDDIVGGILEAQKEHKGKFGF